MSATHKKNTTRPNKNYAMSTFQKTNGHSPNCRRDRWWSQVLVYDRCRQISLGPKLVCSWQKTDSCSSTTVPTSVQSRVQKKGQTVLPTDVEPVCKLPVLWSHQNSVLYTGVYHWRIYIRMRVFAKRWPKAAQLLALLPREHLKVCSNTRPTLAPRDTGIRNQPVHGCFSRRCLRR